MNGKIKNMWIATRCMAALLAGMLAGLAPSAPGQVFGGVGGATTLAGSAAIAGATHLRGNTDVGGPCACAPGSKVAAGSFLKAGSVVNGSALASDTTLAEATAVSGRTTIASGSRLAAGTVLATGTSLAAGTALAAGTTFGAGSTLAKGCVIAGGSFLNGAFVAASTTLTEATTVTGFTTCAGGSVLATGTTFASGTACAAGTTIAGATVVADAAGSTFAQGCVIAAGSVVGAGSVIGCNSVGNATTLVEAATVSGGATLAAGTSLAAGTVLAAGTCLAAGTRVAGDVSVTGITTVAAPCTCGTGSTLAAGTIIAAGSTVNGLAVATANTLGGLTTVVGTTTMAAGSVMASGSVLAAGTIVGGTESSLAFEGRASAIAGAALGVPVTLAECAPLSPSGGAQEAALLTGSIAGTLGAEVCHATTIGQAGVAASEASVANVVFTSCPDLLGQLQVVTADFVMSRANAAWSSTGPTTSGAAEISGLVVNGQSIAVSGQPNQTVTLAGGGTVIINEQIVSQSASAVTMTCNAVHLRPCLGADVIFGSCQAGSCSDCNPNPPASCNDFVTGGGWITGTPSGAKGNFGVGGGIKDGAFWGHLNYIDHGNGMHVKATAVTGYAVDPNDPDCRIIDYNVTIDGNAGTARVRVCDKGEPGRNDIFQIQLSNGYFAGGDLGGSHPGGGNIQLHKCQ